MACALCIFAFCIDNVINQRWQLRNTNTWTRIEVRVTWTENSRVALLCLLSISITIRPAVLWCRIGAASVPSLTTDSTRHAAVRPCAPVRPAAINYMENREKVVWNKLKIQLLKTATTATILIFLIGSLRGLIKWHMNAIKDMSIISMFLRSFKSFHETFSIHWWFDSKWHVPCVSLPFALIM